MGPAIPESAPDGFILETQAVEDLRWDLARLALSAVHHKRKSGPELLKPEELMPKSEVEADLETILSKHAGWVIRGLFQGGTQGKHRGVWNSDSSQLFQHAFSDLGVRQKRDDVVHVDCSPKTSNVFVPHVMVMVPDPILGFKGHFACSLADMRLFAQQCDAMSLLDPTLVKAITTVRQAPLVGGIATDDLIQAGWEIKLFFQTLSPSIVHVCQTQFIAAASTLQRISLTPQDLYIFDNRRLAHGRIRDEARGPMFVIE